MKLTGKSTEQRNDRDIDLLAPFNKSRNLKKLDLSQFIIIKRIHRIQLSVKNKAGYYKSILDQFKSSFTLTRTIKTENRFIYEFSYMDMKIQLISHNINKKKHYYPYWFSIAIHDPDVLIQKKILRILRTALNNDEAAVSLSQVECALDICPLRRDELKYVFPILSHGLVLKHSRAKSSCVFKSTLYQGNKGDVRKGSKGLTCYMKEGLDCARIELRANKDFLERYGPTCLPVFTRDFNLRNHIEYRHDLNKEKINMIVNAITKKVSSKPSSELGQAILEVVYYRYICDSISEEDANYNFIDTSELKPVAAQIDFFRELKKEYGLTHQMSYFFPKNN
ncbi:MAG TPA: hypothetical protein ENH82_15675 [bacterium]|nr:hypothetical protein [bacterium]